VLFPAALVATTANVVATAVPKVQVTDVAVPAVIKIVVPVAVPTVNDVPAAFTQLSVWPLVAVVVAVTA
jgi:hypothetical protein